MLWWWSYVDLKYFYIINFFIFVLLSKVRQFIQSSSFLNIVIFAGSSAEQFNNSCLPYACCPRCNLHTSFCFLKNVVSSSVIFRLIWYKNFFKQMACFNSMMLQMHYRNPFIQYVEELRTACEDHLKAVVADTFQKHAKRIFFLSLCFFSQRYQQSPVSQRNYSFVYFLNVSALDSVSLLRFVSSWSLYIRFSAYTILWFVFFNSIVFCGHTFFKYVQQAYSYNITCLLTQIYPQPDYQRHTAF